MTFGAVFCVSFFFSLPPTVDPFLTLVHCPQSILGDSSFSLLLFMIQLFIVVFVCLHCLLGRRTKEKKEKKNVSKEK